MNPLQARAEVRAHQGLLDLGLSRTLNKLELLFCTARTSKNIVKLKSEPSGGAVSSGSIKGSFIIFLVPLLKVKGQRGSKLDVLVPTGHRWYYSQ